MKNSISLICLICLGLISLSAAVLSYWQLDRVPYGYHVDEFAASVDIGCLATEGVDAHDVPHPMFSNLNYGTPKPPTYIYPAILWAKIFGFTASSLRALSVTGHLLGIIGLFFLARLFFGWRCGVITSTVAILSPWTWIISRVAFESLFSATFLIWGMYFFFRSAKIWSMLLAAVFFAAAMYSYPPFRMQTPLMLLSLLIYTCYKKQWPLKSLMAFAAAVIALIIPLVQKIISGETQQRFNTISIFSKDYLNSIHSTGGFRDIIGIFINNYLMHFKWDFLFLNGDPSYVHSTRHFGILSWMDGAALALILFWIPMLLVKKFRNNNPLLLHKDLVLFICANILIGVLPVALTNSELPNSLRITGAWPFMCLLSGFLLWQACEQCWGMWVVTTILSILFAVSFLKVYFQVYPQEGKGYFNYWTVEEANKLKTNDDWLKFLVVYRHDDYTARYFLMQYHGFSCTQSRVTWENMRDFLKSRRIY